MRVNPEYIRREGQRLAAAMAGKTVSRILVDNSPETVRDFGEPLFGFEMSDNTRVWIMRDPEGNGPGFLSIES
jgi:hypothetical protein